MRFRFMKRPLAAVAATALGAGMLSGLGLLTAAPAPAQSSGVVKINGVSIGTANEPHVACPFTVTFDNFPPVSAGDEDLADARFTVITPTASLPNYTGGFIHDTTSWGSNPPSPQGQIKPSVSDLDSLFGGLLNSNLPFHVRLDTTVKDQATNDVIFSKSKTFWVNNACPHIALTKAADSNGSTVAAGGNTVGYDITAVVTDATAQNFTLSDSLPGQVTGGNTGWTVDTGAETTFPNPASNCSITSGTLTCGPVNLDPGTYTVHITATTPAVGAANCGDITNIASGSADLGLVTPGSTPGSHITVTGCTGTPNPSVNLAKTADSDSALTAGTDNAGFTITATVSNSSAGNPANFTVSDTLPTNTGSWSLGTIPAADTALPNCSISGAVGAQTLTCDESGGITTDATYAVEVNAPTTASSCSGVDNQGTAAATAGSTTQVTGSPAPANAASETVNCLTTVTISKSADSPSVSLGNTAGFTIEVDVTGTGSASNVDVQDQLPATAGPWTIASQTFPGNVCGISPTNLLECTEASLAGSAGGTAYTVDVTAPTNVASCATGMVSNQASATVDTGTPAETAASNSPASASVTVTGCGGGGGGGGGGVITPPTSGGSGGASFLGVNRIGGTDRIDTADLISQATYAAGGAGAVVLARSDLFPDSLAGTPLAVLHSAPILLTPPKYLDPRTAAEIQRVLSHGGTVYLLGQTDALSTTVLNSVKALGYNAVRIGGIDRFATAAGIGSSLGTINRIFLADGANFPDALTAAAASGTGGTAIILTNGKTMPAVSAAFVAAHPVTMYDIGGPAAGAAPAGATLLVGADRYGTSVLVAQTFFSKPTGAGVATGVNFPDALTAGPYLVTLNWPMLLSDPANLPASVSAYLTSVKPSMVALTVFGGVAAVSANVFNQLVALFS